MKCIHLSDLHIGKRVNEFSMLEDQKYILNEILEVIDAEKPDGVFIAGDVYDRTVPSAEAVQLFDGFIAGLAERKLRTFIISGNHDSPERLAFGSKIMDDSGIHFSPVYSGKVAPYVMKDEFGAVNIYMLPFIKPANVKRFYPEEEIDSYTDAVRAAVENMNADMAERNIIITHQFVTGASRSESEEISVGGTDNVDASVFDGFDYVALGHIHRPQNMGEKRIRYCGTPLKYSFSEAGHSKSVTVVELKEKGNLEVREVPLVPLRDMKEIKGQYRELTLKSFYENTSYPEDYVHITLTDEEDVPDAVGKLRVIYKNLMKLDYDNTRTRNLGSIAGEADIESKSPLQLFGEFYEGQNGRDMSDKQLEYMSELIENVWEVEK
ncbi:MAG: exonuclease SbcCD subunit D [Firmicutes bacterium]|nr:exonuclease SbcCD subunit D [Bacillota bacterium]